jgi:hypothetical protein
VEAAGEDDVEELMLKFETFNFTLKKECQCLEYSSGSKR